MLVVVKDEPNVWLLPVGADELKLKPTFGAAEEVTVEVKEPKARLEVVVEAATPKLRGAAEDVVFRKFVAAVVVPKDKVVAGIEVVAAVDVPFRNQLCIASNN